MGTESESRDAESQTALTLVFPWRQEQKSAPLGPGKASSGLRKTMVPYDPAGLLMEPVGLNCTLAAAAEKPAEAVRLLTASRPHFSRCRNETSH